MGTSRSVDLLVDAFERVAQAVPGLLAGLNTAQLAWYPGPFANSIGWLVWHMARVEDDHMAGVAESEQVWLTQGWVDQFAVPYDSLDIGYGQTPDQAHRLEVSGDLLAGYYAAVHARTLEILGGLTDPEFDRVVDRNWDPPVTAAVRIVSVVNDVTQHVGQAAYVRGLLNART
jgi:uncharacterized damage-inducible protein DinB